MKLFKSIFLIVITATLYSCGPAVATVKTTDDNLNKYDSFSYLPNAALQLPDKKVNDGVNRIVIQSVNDNMIDAGYELDRDNPDLLVLVSTKINEETEVEKNPIYASYGYYNRPGIRVNSYYNNYYYYGYTNYPTVVGYDTDTYNYKEGTLVIYLVDKETNETVWKGASSTSIYDSGNVDAMTQLVNAIFEEYPLMKKK
ncbi:uncharacterized protein DUF4136 [Nonlabens dokdonensis]|jgi:hypothetical protein|uniref:Uncharacterized protein DUF4136 n=2 Tax=Nonlabens dokdonensis TaxID=328515 RepID=A0ABX5Q0N4_9FLAO|nr:DUF4136 domain-containing protein [Nonlabens dokdonensis]AGC75914.1 putative lipoprotein [Nonlabens dokdonensis DSW-6]PZX43594.1 uncharacterized protein DUF4136 [Nonlabens dokdonensis]